MKQMIKIIKTIGVIDFHSTSSEIIDILLFQIVELKTKLKELEKDNVEWRKLAGLALSELLPYTDCNACKHCNTTKDKPWCEKYDRECGVGHSCRTPVWEHQDKTDKILNK